MSRRGRSEKFESETQLALAVCAWLEGCGWEVFKEVPTFDGDVDLVAKKEKLLWAIECKLAYSEGLCYQAVSRLPHFHFVSVAVPNTYDSNRIYDRFLRENGIGKIDVMANYQANEEMTYGVSEIWGAKVWRSKSRAARVEHLRRITVIAKKLIPEYKELIPGKPYGNQLTDFKVTMMRIERYLIEEGKATLDELAQEVDHHYCSKTNAKAGLYSAFTKFFPDKYESFKVGKKRYWRLKVGVKDEVI
jgi:hypothetical protein